MRHRVGTPQARARHAPPDRAAAQPRDRALRARAHPHHPHEGQGAPSLRREAHHPGQARGRTACTRAGWWLRDIHDATVVKKLFDNLGARFAARAGGYTRILRLGPRKGDGAEMAILELLGSEYKPKDKAEEKGKKEARRPRARRSRRQEPQGGKKDKEEEAAAE